MKRIWLHLKIKQFDLKKQVLFNIVNLTLFSLVLLAEKIHEDQIQEEVENETRID